MRLVRQFGGRRSALTLGAVALLVMTAAAVATLKSSPRSGNSDTRPVPHPRQQSVVAESVLTTVVGLGDSVPAGTGCGCTSFVVQLGQQLQRAGADGSRVVAHNEATGGQTSTGLLQQVRRQDGTAHSNQVTVVTIGANDFDASLLDREDCQGSGTIGCYRSSLADMERNVRATLRTLRTGRDAKGPVLVTGYWNVFLDGAVAAANGPPYVRDSDSLTRAVNRGLQAASAASGATFVDLYEPFKADGDDTALLAPDGDHPSASGHALIAALLRHHLLPP